MTEFKDKTAIVTGAGQGIGLCIAETFARHGARVVLAEVQGATGNWAQSRIGPRATFMETDVSNEESVRDTVHMTLDRFGRIDFLINNAGLMHQKPLHQTAVTDWNRILAVHLTGAFLCSKHCSAPLRETGGAIVNIASTRALMSEPDTPAYSAAKGGLVALTHSLAITLGPEVRVNCISPGWIVTRDYLPNPDAYGYDVTEEDHRQHPAGRAGRPEDVAEMALYLCCPRAGFITGQNFIVDGGMTRKMVYI